MGSIPTRRSSYYTQFRASVAGLLRLQFLPRGEIILFYSNQSNGKFIFYTEPSYRGKYLGSQYLFYNLHLAERVAVSRRGGLGHQHNRPASRDRPAARGWLEPRRPSLSVDSITAGASGSKMPSSRGREDAYFARVAIEPRGSLYGAWRSAILSDLSPIAPAEGIW